MPQILLIDDDVRLATPLAEYFKRYNLNLINEIHPYAGLDRLKQLQQPPIDLIILDIMLPDMDGFAVCREIRKNSDIPILMLTARGDVTDRVVGLELGADDYLPKPFDPRELVARIHNILKRIHAKKTDKNSLSTFIYLKIDLKKRLILLNQQEIKLTTKEYDLLILLSQSPDKTFSRDNIMNALSGIDANFFSRSIDILVSRLRQKLKPLDCIQTVWGVGYRFIAAKA